MKKESLNSFRRRHLVAVLEEYNVERGPLDRYLNLYCRHHRALGSHDRKAIIQRACDLYRWKGWLDTMCGSDATWEDKLCYWESHDPDPRLALPPALFDWMVSRFGEEKTIRYGTTTNTQAPLTIRANSLKTTRDELLQRFEKTRPCAESPLGIRFDEPTYLLKTEEYTKGFFEIQDEASQLVALMVDAKPGDQVIDYCAGAGGKSLAFAPQMENRGQLYLHDIRTSALHEARRRLKRAGIQNVQFKLPERKGEADWVLVDAPCSGSGTWRRHVEMKWQFTPSRLSDYTKLQREIVQEALAYLKPTGKLVYATCSIFPEENEEQVEWIKQTMGGEVINEFHSWPEEGEKDGLFGAVLAFS